MLLFSLLVGLAGHFIMFCYYVWVLFFGLFVRYMNPRDKGRGVVDSFI